MAWQANLAGWLLRKLMKSVDIEAMSLNQRAAVIGGFMFSL